MMVIDKVKSSIRYVWNDCIVEFGADSNFMTRTFLLCMAVEFILVPFGLGSVFTFLDVIMTYVAWRFIALYVSDESKGGEKFILAVLFTLVLVADISVHIQRVVNDEVNQDIDTLYKVEKNLLILEMQKDADQDDKSSPDEDENVSPPCDDDEAGFASS